MNAYTDLFINAVMMCAIAATIYHARKLSRQFEETQANRKAFEQLIQALNLAASRAEAAVRTLREAATVSGDELQETVNKAHSVAHELEIIVQAADNVAERLDRKVSAAAKTLKTDLPAEPAVDDTIDETLTATPQKSAVTPRTRAEKELLEALKAKK